MRPSPEPDVLTAILLAKVREDCQALERERIDTADAEVAHAISALVAEAEGILAILMGHPGWAFRVRKFIDYYQDCAVMLARRHRELGMAGDDGPDVAGLRDGIIQGLWNLLPAFRDAKARLGGEDMMDMRLELDVLAQELRMDGFAMDGKGRGNQGERVCAKNSSMNCLVNMVGASSHT